MTNRLPSVSQELLDYLNTQYPERCPDPTWSERDIWMRVGERRLVRKLIDTFKTQIEDSLAKHV